MTFYSIGNKQNRPQSGAYAIYTMKWRFRKHKMPTTEIMCPGCRDKVVAKQRDGKFYVWCKICKEEVELVIEEERQNEPNSTV